MLSRSVRRLGGQLGRWLTPREREDYADLDLELGELHIIDNVKIDLRGVTCFAIDCDFQGGDCTCCDSYSEYQSGYISTALFQIMDDDDEGVFRHKNASK